jgi:hypothetical protein
MERYNAKGMRVVCPIYPIEPIPPQTQYYQKTDIVDFSPTRSFSVKVSKDTDKNYEISLRFNTKNFLSATNNAINAIGATKNIVGKITSLLM